MLTSYSDWLRPPQYIHRVLVVLPHLIVEARVLDRERGKITHGDEESHLRVAEDVMLVSVDPEHADWSAMSLEGYAGQGDDALLCCLLRILKARIVRHVLELGGVALQDLAVHLAPRHLDRPLIEIRIAQVVHGAHLQSLAVGIEQTDGRRPCVDRLCRFLCEVCEHVIQIQTVADTQHDLVQCLEVRAERAAASHYFHYTEKRWVISSSIGCGYNSPDGAYLTRRKPIDTSRRRVGLGLAARGDVREAVEYALRAEQLGFESVWIHDSYFERDPVTYLASIASVQGIRVGAGAMNPYTRHPVVLAMTGSALDDLAPGRFMMALGSGLPLRLSQMNIPFDDTVAEVSRAIDLLRTLWAGERVVLNPQVPPLQPMFAPPHRLPLYIAGYQGRFLDLCGEKADGYLARPAESIPALRLMKQRVQRVAEAHGRSPENIEFAGYVLSLVGDTRRDALNRAKREPFVIYMMSVLSNVSLKRAGFPPELRDQIAAAWRAEDYHRAGQLIPDELLDAFLACGTREQVAQKALEYREAALDVPLVQPIRQ